ncbi:MAG: hypothetical protein KIC91_07345, partial [Sutterella sp.]|nr:hypothetical protein [Sutterella sp.]
ADTLALGYVLGATPCTRDFHPLERAHAERTNKSPRLQTGDCLQDTSGGGGIRFLLLAIGCFKLRESADFFAH